MNREEVFEKALRSYSAYYDINRETPEAPFQAEAAFHSHSDAYFLVKSATLGEAESHEYVFFASSEKSGCISFGRSGSCRLGERKFSPGETTRQSPQYRRYFNRNCRFRYRRSRETGTDSQALQELPHESPGLQSLSPDCCRSFIRENLL